MSIDNMISELAAAKVAMEENPWLKAKVQELLEVVEHRVTEYEELYHCHETLDSAHKDATDRIAQLEAELEQARFRELAVNQKLDKLVSSFRETIDEVAPVPVQVAEENSNVVEQSTTVLESDIKDDGMIEEAERTPGAEVFSPRPEPDYVTSNGVFGDMKTQAGKHYSMKPAAMPWPTWVDLGGQRPWWLNDDELNKLRQGSALAS